MAGSTFSFQYQKATNKIRVFMEERKLNHGDRLPAEREFALLFGMGRPTINKAITSLIAEGLLRRDGYKLYVAGPPVHVAKTLLIGVLCPHPLLNKQRVSHNLVEAAHDVCRLAGAHFTPMLSLDGAQQRAQLLEILKLNPDGIVIWPYPQSSYADLFQQIIARNIPLVVNDCNWGPFDFVGVDNFAGMRAILNHLAELGHREIAYFTRPLNNPNLEERLEGYRYFTSRFVNQSSQKRIYKLEDEGEEALEQAFLRFRAKEKNVTALCCSHDAVAVGLVRLCLQNGIEVPEDISITGFDGTDTGEQCSRPLTTVAQDFYQLGSLAVDLLLRRIRMRHVRHAAHVQQIHSTPYLVTRTSAARARRAKLPALEAGKTAT